MPEFQPVPKTEAQMAEEYLKRQEKMKQMQVIKEQ